MNLLYCEPPAVGCSLDDLALPPLDILVNLPPVPRNGVANDSMCYELQEVPTIYAYQWTNKAVARGMSSRIGKPEITLVEEFILQYELVPARFGLRDVYKPIFVKYNN